MHFLTSSILISCLFTYTLAGPIQRPNDVIRHNNQPPKRYVVNVLHSSSAPRARWRRQAPTDPANSAAASETDTASVIDPPQPTRTGSGTEDGAVPAVGAGSDNTSLLSLLTQTTIEPATAAAVTSQATSSTDAAAVTAVAETDSASTVTDTASNSTSTTKGSEDGSVPAVGAGVGGENTSLLSLLTQSSITAVATQAASATDTSITNTAAAAAATTTTTDITSSGGENTEPTGPAPSVAGTGTAIEPNTAAQNQPTSTITVQAQTTVLETSVVTAEVTLPSSNAATATASVVSSSSTDAAAEQQQGTPSITIVFVTASPTFTGPIGGYTTLSPDANGNAATTATDAASPDSDQSATPSIFTLATSIAPGLATITNTPPAPAASTEEASPTVLTTSLAATPAVSQSAAEVTPATALPATLNPTPTTLTDALPTTSEGGLAVVPITPGVNNVQASTVTVTETQVVTTTVTAR